MSKIDTSSWKEFKLDDILQKVNTVKVPLKKGDCPTVPTDTYVIPARTATTNNQGLSCYVPADMCTVLKDKISVSANGDFCAFWHDSDFTILQDAYALEGKNFELTENVALFLISAMAHSFSEKYNWNNKSGWEKLRNETISLPVKETEEINWEYMQERISELEQERISELEQYLIATGLNDYELTEEDREILDRINSFSWREFRLADIAELNNGNKMDKNKMSHFNPAINFVSRTATNNGISDIVDKINGVDPYPSGCITLAFGGSVGSCFLQEAPFYTGQNVGVISLPSNVSKNAKLFFSLALGKKCKFSFHAFGNEINKHFKTDLSVSLPVTSSGDPDWAFMERYIRAIEKIAIADVVKYKDEVIQKTKESVA